MLKFLNYFFLAYVLLKPVLNMLFYSIDGAGRIQIMLGMLVLFFNINNHEFQKVLKLPSVVIWGLWGIYSTINWLLHRVENNVIPWIFIGNDIFLVWVVLVVAIYESKKNYHSILKFVLYSFVCYVLFGLLFQSGAKYDDMAGRGGAILGNMLPLTSLSMVATASFMYIKKWLKIRSYIVIVILSICAILMVATRKAFGGLLIILVFLLLAKYPLKSIKNWVYLLVTGLVFSVGLSLIMDYTVLGERFHNIDETASVYNTSDIPLLNILGDRAYFYIRGVEVFKEHPLTGIGINNFMYTDSAELPFHTEYMTQLAENGILGTILYILFYFSIFKQIHDAKKNRIIGDGYWVYIGWMIAILFVSLTAWVYSFKHYYIVIGLIIGGILNNRKIYDENCARN